MSDGVKLAHIMRDESGKTIAEQSLAEHLINTAQCAAEIGQEINCRHLSFLLGVLHDLGKCKKNFQQRVLGFMNQNVNHSSGGASYLQSKLEELRGEIGRRKLDEACRYREILFYVITAHHGLYDAIGEGRNISGKGKYVSRIEDRMALEEDKDALKTEIYPFVENELGPAISKELDISFDELILCALEELKCIVSKIEPLISVHVDSSIKIRARRVYEGFLTRLFLSILKTADCFDSMQFSQKDKITPLTKEKLNEIFSGYHDATERRAKKFAENVDSSPLNKVRMELSELAQNHALRQEHGISQFEMPTGAGKTETGLRYGVNNIKKFSKGRLVYMAPFLSIVEQSAQSIKNVVGEEFCLEHHSNVVNDEYESKLDEIQDETKLDDQLYLPLSYVTDYWDAAIIVTTMVQFYETLFGERSANICRFCKLIDSTIIIDEIQSLPVRHIYCFNLMLNFLSQIMKANILLCSATQPPFDDEMRLAYPIRYAGEKRVVPSNEELEELGKDLINYSVFERSKVFPAWIHKENAEDMELDDVLDLLCEQIKWANSALCILNTKGAVKTLFEKVEEKFPEARVFYLTTNLCAAHRFDLIKEMRAVLKSIREGSSTKQDKLICVTTSLIEAGVDVDFDVVLRSITGADSIEQARGRCNREGLLRKGGKVFILRLKEDNTNVKGLKDIYKRGEITTSFVKKQLEDGREALNMRQLTEDFYQKYFLENSDEMIFKMLMKEKGKEEVRCSALELLSTSDAKVQAVGNSERQKEFQKKHRLWQSFRTASKWMKLIDQDAMSVIVPYKNEDLLKELIEAIDAYNFTKVKKLLKRLQRYTVNVYRYEELDSRCYFVHKELGIYILHIQNYDMASGIKTDDTAFVL
ncbi:MAG: CRISPR-associated helicase Cas3' [Eubacteriales bacterium]|jgi:CRISPR-associated endonuclease/helicase Cas3